MSSWGFLVKKIIHTVITLFVVLILLFIIFRLMPGDPTKFFIKPGMDVNAKHLLAERYGFERRVPAPGNEYKVDIDTSMPGAYGFTVNATDNANREETYYHAYNSPGILLAGDNTTVFSVGAILNSGGTVTANVELIFAIPSDFVQNFPVNITHDGAVLESFNLAFTSNSTSAGGSILSSYTGTSQTTISSTEYGNYFISFSARDEIGTPITNICGFSVNKSPSELQPFNLEGARVITTDLATESEFKMNVSSANGLRDVRLTLITDPSGATTYDPANYMTHTVMFIQVPYWEQFGIYMKNMLSFDFGNSFRSGRPVWDEMIQRIPATLLLFGSALLLSALLGILMGVVMAWRRGSKGEVAGIVLSLFFNTMPVFWFGLILLAAFAYILGWFPLSGWTTPGADYTGLQYVGDLLWHLALPLITLTIAHLAGWLLLQRNSMLEVMGEDYITTAKAKGLSERKIMYRHAARNAMLPTVTAIAMSIGGVVGGGMLTETIFSWPGMGRYLVTSTLAYDYPAVQGAFFILAILTIVGNFFADILYAYLDPRVRLSR